MQNRPLVLVLVSLVCACADDSGTPVLEPYRGDWDRLEGPVPLARTQGGGYDVSEITIGGRVFDDNFANRGDIVVEYEEGRDSIEIFGRRFTSAADPEGAELQLDRLALWISDTGVSTPTADAEEPSCTVTWHDGCSVRTVYEGGDVQPARSGMDLRVILPADYKGLVNVETQDLVQDDSYPNRGNVCIWGLPGSADVTVDQGQVLVTLADDLRAAPTCPPADIAACDEAGWATDCPCTAQNHAFGQLTIEPRAQSDIAVQTVPDVWSRIDIAVELSENIGEVPCRAEIDVPGAVVESQDTLSAVAQAAVPPGAIAGGGYGIRARSQGCNPTQFIEDPELFDPHSDGMTDPHRGDITVCEGCIQNASCDDFLEDGLRVQ